MASYAYQKLCEVTSMYNPLAHCSPKIQADYSKGNELLDYVKAIKFNLYFQRGFAYKSHVHKSIILLLHMSDEESIET